MDRLPAVKIFDPKDTFRVREDDDSIMIIVSIIMLVIMRK
jgi:hypothetical protein